MWSWVHGPHFSGSKPSLAPLCASWPSFVASPKPSGLVKESVSLVFYPLLHKYFTFFSKIGSLLRALRVTLYSIHNPQQLEFLPLSKLTSERTQRGGSLETFSPSSMPWEAQHWKAEIAYLATIMVIVVRGSGWWWSCIHVITGWVVSP